MSVKFPKIIKDESAIWILTEDNTNVRNTNSSMENNKTKRR